MPGPIIWIVAAAALVAGAGVVAFFVAKQRKRRPDLIIHITQPATHSLPPNHEWYLDGPVDFSNVSHRQIVIRSIRAEVSAHGKPVLQAKRILGIDESKFRGMPHPPDISMKMPIYVEPGSTVTYRFHTIFITNLRQMWENGLLHIYATDERGVVTEAVRTILPPRK
jgi:hypothetical protein